MIQQRLHRRIEAIEFAELQRQTFGKIARTHANRIQALLPDGAHEVLKAMHGIKLDEALRQAILADGFYAWGAGIQ